MCGLGVLTTCFQRVTDVAKISVYEHKLGVRFIRQLEQGGTLGSSRGLGNSRRSAMLKCRGQRVEVYLLGEGGLGWFKRVTSGAFPSDLG